MKSLLEMALEEVCLKLECLIDLIRQNDYRLPCSISQLIYTHLSRHFYKKDSNIYCNLMHRDITEVSSFHLNYKMLKYMPFVNSMNTHDLRTFRCTVTPHRNRKLDIEKLLKNAPQLQIVEISYKSFTGSTYKIFESTFKSLLFSLRYVTSLKEITLNFKSSYCFVNKHCMKNFFSCLPNLEVLNFNGKLSNEMMLVNLCNGLKCNKNSLKVLSLTGKLNEKAMNELTNLLSSCKKLKEVTISQNFTAKSAHLINIIDSLVNSCNTLRKIDISGNFLICYQSVLGKLVGTFPNLKSIRFDQWTYKCGTASRKQQNGMDSSFVKVCNSVSNLKHVNLCGKTLNGNNFKSILDNLKNCTNLKSIRLDFNLFTNIQFEASYFDFPRFPKLDEVHFLGGTIESTAISIFSILQTRKMQSTTIDFQRIENDGLIEAKKGLEFSYSSLTDLRLKDIQDADLLQFSEVFTLFESLQKVRLSNLRLNSITTSKIFKGLRLSASTLREIEFSNCSLKETDGDDIGELLLMCTKLEVIVFSGNEKLKNGQIQIFNALHSSAAKIRTLDMGRICASTDILNSLVSLLNKCNKLEIFKIMILAEIGYIHRDLFRSVGRSLRNSINSLTIINHQFGDSHNLSFDDIENNIFY